MSNNRSRRWRKVAMAASLLAAVAVVIGVGIVSVRAERSKEEK